MWMVGVYTRGCEEAGGDHGLGVKYSFLLHVGATIIKLGSMYSPSVKNN
jgi:hypothetical protein